MIKPLVTILLSLFVFSFACKVTGPDGMYHFLGNVRHSVSLFSYRVSARYIFVL